MRDSLSGFILQMFYDRQIAMGFTWKIFDTNNFFSPSDIMIDARNLAFHFQICIGLRVDILAWAERLMCKTIHV